LHLTSPARSLSEVGFVGQRQRRTWHPELAWLALDDQAEYFIGELADACPTLPIL
jgi:hypothetical protein